VFWLPNPSASHRLASPSRNASLGVRRRPAGDGLTDDTAAIQEALDRLNDAGGGTLHLPAGIYLVSMVSAERALRIYPNIVIRGDGRDVTRIRLAPNQGKYRHMLAPSPVSADCSGFALADLTVDQNGTENPGTPTAGNERIALNIFAGARIRVANCRFTDIDAINTLVTNGPAVRDVWIVNNVFDDVGSQSDHDYSGIYFHGDGVVVQGNSFRARRLPSPGARTAIETHGDRQRVAYNLVAGGFRYGANITGVNRPFTGKNIVVHGNTMDDVQAGVLLWAYDPAVAFENLAVTDNLVTLNHDAWSRYPGVPTRGICLEPNSNASVRNARIAGNQIRLANYGGGASPSDDQSGGIEWWRINQAPVDENVVIEGNIVDGSIGAGIRLSASMRQVRVAGNLIRNPGRGKGGFADPFRSGILLAGRTMTDVVLADNLIVDDQEPHTIRQGIYNAAGALTDARIVNNSLRVADGAAVRDYHGDPGPARAPYLVAYANAPSLPAVETRFGSQVIRPATGEQYTQVAFPAGTTWVSSR
jgi:hypothetical protein